MSTAQTKRGGLRLASGVSAASDTALVVAPLPAQVVLPLQQHSGPAAVPTVQPGEAVLRGQAVGAPSAPSSAWVHSPLSGVVRAIELHANPYLEGAAELAVVIDGDDRDQVHPGCLPVPYASLAPEELIERIAEAGIVGLGGALFPTGAKLQSSRRSPLTHLILNGAECEPFIGCDDALLRERAAEVILGAQVLLHALQVQRCTIALEADKPATLRILQTCLAGSGDARITVASVPAFYPAGGERQLITALCGDEVPARGLPCDIGVVCQNVGTAAAIACLVRDGEPLLRRIVTVAGGGVRRSQHFEARLGVAFTELIEQCGGYTPQMERLIMGGPMMGIALPHDAMPVMKATNCILAAANTDLRLRSAEMPCIRCGDCAQVCPANLLPQQLYRHAQDADRLRLESFGLADCIECGCCDYMCPSHIKLTARFHAAKFLGA